VIDGVTVGHPCCALHNCHVALANNRHRFCPDHHLTHSSVCAIIGCENSVLTGSLSCGEPSHQEVEHIHRERGQARFQLQERLQRARVAHPNDAIAEDRNLLDLVDTEAEEEEFDVEDDTQTNPPPLVLKQGRGRCRPRRCW